MCSECEYEQLLDEIDTLIGDCEDLPEAGEDFANSVDEKARSIRATITEHEHCSQRQKDAISNMQDGVNKWFTD